MSDAQPIDFQVARDDFRRGRFVRGAPVDDLAEGRVLLRVDRFALTSNNVSYAAAGDLLDYWGFFPAPEGWGRIPAMGFGEVIASRHPDVAEGLRVFGFFPMSRHLVIEAECTGAGLVDRAAHRARHAPVYRSYTDVTRDALYDPAREDQIMLLRGLFMTSFLVDDLYADEDFFGATASIVTSASSKTSIALAHCLARRERGPVIGLTSARNRDFVADLGCYDEVLRYDELDRLPALVPAAGAVMTDMAGDAAVVRGVHERLADRLRHSCTVGGTHWEAPPSEGELPGPKPEFFFAPARIVKRTEDWGAQGLQARLGDAWRAFVDWSDGWLQVRRHAGETALEQTYRAALAGDLDPRDGHVMTLWTD